MNQFITSCKLGIFLGIRQLKRSSRWTTGLIVFIMTLTFLNLVVVSGILIGLIEGGNNANKEQFTGDVILTTRAGKSDISNTQTIITTIAADPTFTAYTDRYIQGGSIEANYQTRTDFNAKPDTAGTQVTGINPVREDNFSNLSNYVVEGEFLDPSQSGYVVLGANLLRRFSAGFGDGFDSLDETYPGDRVKITVNGKTQEFIVKGIVKSKVGEMSIRAFMTQGDFLRLVDRGSLNANEIATRRSTSVTDDQAKEILMRNGFDQYAKIQTATEAIPDFLNQIKIAFTLLGNMIGAIGIVVASITIFIVIFINAVTRRKFIGIMKGIGVSSRAIQISYLFQSFFYAVSGSILGLVILYGLLVPFFANNPINFPFSDGILVAEPVGTAIRVVILLIVTLIAGFIPARMIVRKNTLDSILGR
jgi:ABC-type lipoprotein release transport system permease subunit